MIGHILNAEWLNELKFVVRADLAAPLRERITACREGRNLSGRFVALSDGEEQRKVRADGEESEGHSANYKKPYHSQESLPAIDALAA